MIMVVFEIASYRSAQKERFTKASLKVSSEPGNREYMTNSFCSCLKVNEVLM